MKIRAKLARSLAVAGVLGGILAACGSSSSATSTTTAASVATTTTGPSAASFYKGKTMTFIVPFGAAGGYEQWALTLKPYLIKYLGLAALNIVNDTGGGGTVGSNDLYAAKPDGLTIGNTDATGDVLNQILKVKGLKYDTSKFSWIGRPDTAAQVGVSIASSGITSMKELVSTYGPGSSKTLVALAAGQGGAPYIGERILFNMLKVHYRQISTFQGSSAAKVGLLSGDGSFLEIGYSSMLPLISSKKVNPLYVWRQNDFAPLAGVPSISALETQFNLSSSDSAILNSFDGVMELGHALAGPPGIPADRLAFLRAAFKQALADPGLAAQAKKENLVTGYGSGSTLESIIKAANGNAAQIVAAAS
ncbi:MAG: hypothetical protein HKL84_01595 [Acidimicrobiaceae bacterium]|nr:hypothetical protein [Acidimicrobiaceae bacterium]